MGIDRARGALVLLAVGLGGLAPGDAAAQQVQLLSKALPPSDAAGAQGLGATSLSADGRFLVYLSTARNLVAGQVDRDFTDDVFLFDRVTATVTLVSHAAGSATTTGDASSQGAAISDDGDWVAFSSSATNLVAGQVDGGGGVDIFVWERATDVTTLVSHAAGTPTTAGSSFSNAFSISGDGAYVAFQSASSNLVPGGTDGNFTEDVFVWSRATNTAAFVSHAAGAPSTAANGFSADPAISSDGGFVAFRSSAPNIVAGLVGAGGVFLFERATGVVSLVSHVPGSATTTGDRPADSAVISGDGSYTAFTSGASNLVPGQVDTNGVLKDVFLYERSSGLVTLVSHSAASLVTTADNQSSTPAISLDGGIVLFLSMGTDLVTGQVEANAGFDVFWFERATGNVFLASHSSAAPLTTPDAASDEAGLSPDGNWIAFSSAATDVVSGQVEANTVADVFLVERTSGIASLVSRRTGAATTTGAAPQSAAGLAVRADALERHVAFLSAASDLVAGVADHSGDFLLVNDAFLFQQTAGLNQLASPTVPALFSSTAGGTSQLTLFAGLRTSTSADGRYVAFESGATNLVSGQVDANGSNDVFLHDRVGGTMTLVSHVPGQPARAGSGASSAPSLSTDGRYVAFQSLATDVVAGQTEPTGAWSDVFVFDRVTGTVVLASHLPGQLAFTGNAPSTNPVISGDGNWIAFLSRAVDIVPGSDTNGGDDVMLFDRGAGVVRLVSHIPGAATTTGNGTCDQPAVNDPPSAGGTVRVSFRSLATDLVALQVDVGGTPDVFLYTVAPESMQLVTAAAGTLTNAVGGPNTSGPALSADGGWVAFASQASNLVIGQVDATGFPDVFLFDQATATNMLVSRQSGTATTVASAASFAPAPSQDGRYVAFQSQATNLVAGVTDSNASFDVFLFDRVSGTNALVSRRAGAPTQTAGAESREPAIDGAGNRVVFLSKAGDLVPGQTGSGTFDGVFLFDRPSGSVLLASPAAAAARRRAEGNAQSPIVSRSGVYVAFTSGASDLVAADFNQSNDVFQFEPLFADLEVTKSDGLTNAVPGTPITYTITVTNNGPSTVTELDLVDVLPPELMTPSFIPAGGVYDSGTGLWNGLTLLPLGFVTMDVLGTIDPAATGTLTNSVTVGSRGLFDPQPSNDTAVDVDTLSPEADLVVLKADSPDPVPTSGNLVYTITVRNDGPSTATGVSLVDTLPSAPAVTFLSSIPGAPTCMLAASTVTCSLGTVAPGSGGIKLVTIEVLAPGSPGSIDNTVSVSSPVFDPALANNATNAGTLVTNASAAIQFFTVTSTDQRNVLEWRTPPAGLETQIRYDKAPTGTSSCTEPTSTGGTPLAPIPFVANANQSLIHDTPALENDTTYCYGIFVKTGASPDTYSAGLFARGRPFSTGGSVQWAFSTGATSVVAPTVSTTAAYVVSNDRALYAIARGPLGGRWFVGPAPWIPFRMALPAQARSPVVPTIAVPGATEVVFVGSQDGSVYAIDSVAGGGPAGMPLWQSPVLAGGLVQAAPAGLFQDFGAPLDRILVGSRNSGGSSEFASLRTTDGGVQDSFSNSGSLGIVSGMASVDYASGRVYFTSRSFAATLETLWCLTVTPSFGPCAAWSGVALGDVDGSPVVRGGYIYVGDTTGIVHVVRESDGGEEWSFATFDGGVKGFVFPDRNGGDLFFSTTNKVFGLYHLSGAGTKSWEATLSGGARPSTVLWAPGSKRVYVGGSDGYLYELDFTSATLATPPIEKRVKLGDGAALVGAPSLDRGHDLIYVGSEAGIVYAVQTPFP